MDRWIAYGPRIGQSYSEVRPGVVKPPGDLGELDYRLETEGVGGRDHDDLLRLCLQRDGWPLAQAQRTACVNARQRGLIVNNR